jgi:hypothetical protein
VSRHVGRELATLEARTRKFFDAARSSTLPPAVLDAALSNLSILVTKTPPSGLPMVSFTASKAVMTTPDAATEAARMYGTMNRPRLSCFPA